MPRDGVEIRRIAEEPASATWVEDTTETQEDEECWQSTTRRRPGCRRPTGLRRAELADPVRRRVAAIAVA